MVPARMCWLLSLSTTIDENCRYEPSKSAASINCQLVPPSELLSTPRVYWQSAQPLASPVPA